MPNESPIPPEVRKLLYELQRKVTEATSPLQKLSTLLASSGLSPNQQEIMRNIAQHVVNLNAALQELNKEGLLRDVLSISQKGLVFLQRLHERVDGDRFKFVNMFELGNELGFDNSTTSKVFDYVRNEGWAKQETSAGDIAITHKGIKEREKSS